MADKKQGVVAKVMACAVVTLVATFSGFWLATGTPEAALSAMLSALTPVSETLLSWGSDAISGIGDWIVSLFSSGTSPSETVPGLPNMQDPDAPILPPQG